MKKRILDIVDVQNDFIKSNGALSINEAEPIIKRINKFLQQIDNIDFALFKLDTHFSSTYIGSEESGLFPIHCAYGSKGWDLSIDEESLNKSIPKYYMLKNLFNMWADKQIETGLENDEGLAYNNLCKIGNSKDGLDINSVPRDEFMNKNQIDAKAEVLIIGVASDYCVHDAILGYLQRGCSVIVLEDLVKGIGTDVEGRAKSGNIKDVIKLDVFKQYVDIGKLKIKRSSDILNNKKLDKGLKNGR